MADFIECKIGNIYDGMHFNIAGYAIMNWDHVELFVEVVDSLSFTSVAAGRNVAPSSVSRAIANLESELGVKLFHRSPRQIVPTEAGETFYQKVTGLVSGFEDAKRAVLDVSNEPRGVLRVTAPAVYGQKMLVPKLSLFKAKYPQIELELFLVDRYVDLLAERIDVGIRLGSLKDSNYVAQKLHDMNFILCASPNYLKLNSTPSKPDDLINHECLVFLRDSGPAHWRFKNKNGKLNDVSVKGSYRLNSSESVKQCALSDMGVALLPDWLVETEVKTGELIPLLNGYTASNGSFESSAFILQPSRGFQPLKSKVFIDFCLERLSGR